ncbi:hypothetical protein [Sphingobacterium yanglingense]|uniref:Uncharacterized protein n=1 Tax=Sphingobacterium yanglingense TaxID=1437280 RepID=A0A4R6WMI3_9SPHI|nr:hypothetical protein [Sphingobacterium yanglingense]TDQ79555.1 hypothetical protein CLV99_0998 [Sphingobacterium yanglingense]
MTLGFMQTWPKEMGQADSKTYFIEKIQLGLLQSDLIKGIDYVDSLEDYRSKFGGNWHSKAHLSPKLHTIRQDSSNRWKAGNDIHFAVNGRTKNRFQFAPVVKCVSVQDIEILSAMHLGSNDPRVSYADEVEFCGEKWAYALTVIVDGKQLDRNAVEVLAANDGFESVWDFFKYFDKNFKGKLVHWTNLRY